MLTLCNTARGRVACGMGGVLIAVLALACLWGFSPSVTAGDEPPARVTAPKKDLPPPACPDIGLPPAPLPENKAVLTEDVPPLTRTVPTTPPAPTPPPPPVGGTAPVPLPPVPAAAPPAADLAPPLPPAGPVTLTGAAKTANKESAPAPVPTAAIENQDIKQLLAQLSQVRAERAQLDEKERQTIQAVKRKYQEQKKALEQLARELRQLGISCDDGAADREP